jgi:hypothetical protein
MSRSPSIRRHERALTSSTIGGQPASVLNREDQMRQIKNELFLKDINELLQLAQERLNVQASLTNRTGYFYIVNQSTGLVLQAVDFTTTHTLKEQIELNQKRLQSSSIKQSKTVGSSSSASSSAAGPHSKGPRFYLMPKKNPTATANNQYMSSPQMTKKQVTPVNTASISSSLSSESADDEQLWYYYLINGCVANKIIRSGHCMAASSLNAKSPVCFWPNVKTTNCSWFFNSQDQTIVSGLSDDLVLDYVIIDEPPNQRYAVVIDTKIANKASQKWSFEFC